MKSILKLDRAAGVAGRKRSKLPTLSTHTPAPVSSYSFLNFGDASLPGIVLVLAVLEGTIVFRGGPSHIPYMLLRVRASRGGSMQNGRVVPHYLQNRSQLARSQQGRVL